MQFDSHTRMFSFKYQFQLDLQQVERRVAANGDIDLYCNLFSLLYAS